LGGIKIMDRLPTLVFITDIRREQIAVKEANKLGIPIIAMVDTNCDPTPIDYVVPANDDAIRSIKLIANKLADAVIEGQQIRAAILAEEEEEEMVEPAAAWEEQEEKEEEVPVSVEEFEDRGQEPVAAEAAAEKEPAKVEESSEPAPAQAENNEAVKVGSETAAQTGEGE
jgi:small subunit ribosomal protein S2